MSGNGDATIRSAADIWVNRVDPSSPWQEQTSAIFGFVSAAGGLGTIDIRQEQGSSFFLAGPLSINCIYGLHYGLGGIRVSGAGSIYSNEPDLAYGLQGAIDSTLSSGNILVRQERSGLVDFIANESAGAFAYNRGAGDTVIEAAGVSTLYGNENDGLWRGQVTRAHLVPFLLASWIPPTLSCKAILTEAPAR
ncbi:hypothetical protein [Devosia sp. 2618]|uniref:hypothetical protein n=1 Tax=Devosia sp. 2618 TaxID=3156454 RepID=UPI0033992019